MLTGNSSTNFLSTTRQTRAYRPTVTGLGYISKFASGPPPPRASTARKFAYPHYPTTAGYPATRSPAALAARAADASGKVGDVVHVGSDMSRDRLLHVEKGAARTSQSTPQQIFYPHLWSQRSASYRPGSVPVGGTWEEGEESRKAREEIIQRPRELWARLT